MTSQLLSPDKIIIPYNYKGIRLNRFLGIAFIVLSIVGFFNNADNYLFNYGYLIIGSGYIYLYFYIYSKAGLLIKDGVIRVQPIGKSIAIADVIEFKKFAGDYILITLNSQLKINTQLLDAEGLQQLDAILNVIPEEFIKEIPNL